MCYTKTSPKPNYKKVYHRGFKNLMYTLSKNANEISWRSLIFLLFVDCTGWERCVFLMTHCCLLSDASDTNASTAHCNAPILCGIPRYSLPASILYGGVSLSSTPHVLLLYNHPNKSHSYPPSVAILSHRNIAFVSMCADFWLLFLFVHIQLVLSKQRWWSVIVGQA